MGRRDTSPGVRDRRSDRHTSDRRHRRSGHRGALEVVHPRSRSKRIGLGENPVAEGVVIRPERDADHPVIAEVVRAAFVGHPDEVASFVERIRASEQFIPELALVAEDSSGVIAHVLGVGAWLIWEALGRAEEAGEPAVMVEGIPAYYPRFGFEPASALGFISPHPKIPDDAFMVKRLPGYSPDLAGRIVYPAAFDALGYERPV